MTLAPALAAVLMLVAADPLAAWRGANRVLVVSAANAADPALARQRTLWASMGRQARVRDLVLAEAVGEGPQARALRRAAGLDDAGFSAALIGKDGGVKLRVREPIGADRLNAVIDAMPMRRQERSERGE